MVDLEEFLRDVQEFPRSHELFRLYLRTELDRELLAAVQRTRLTEVLVHAATTVAVYQGLGLTAGDIRPDALGCLAAFGLISKETILARYDDHLSSELDADKCFYSVTSGSTGTPFEIVHDQERETDGAASMMRRLQAWGLGLGGRLLHAAGRRTTWRQRVRSIYGLMSWAEFGIADTPQQAGRASLDQMIDFDPDVIMAHGSELVLLGQALERAGLQLRPRVLLTYGESLSARTRRHLEQVFRAPARDVYGMQEFGCVAWQCPEGAYHIDHERVLVQVCDTAGRPLPAGEYGEFVITGLINRSMPLIRYRTGDYGSLSAGACRCGRVLPALEIFDGKDVGFLVLPGGQLLNPYTVKRFLEEQPVAQFQVIQDRPELVRVRVAPEPGFAAAAVEAWLRRVFGSYGCQVELEVCSVDQMMGAGGKVRMFQCTVPVPGI